MYGNVQHWVNDIIITVGLRFVRGVVKRFWDVSVPGILLVISWCGILLGVVKSFWDDSVCGILLCDIMMWNFTLYCGVWRGQIVRWRWWDGEGWPSQFRAAEAKDGWRDPLVKGQVGRVSVRWGVFVLMVGN